ncbi:hypothetical protein HU200_018070 [Digitaria exilis]|uniref:NYN domain-containing protein n=1 Tax=Digitaria exilis TaxID=1010633 RepID=A0A835KI85_9POAL|nr:hypothetical protein HU200_018070 [Digitaria exilis]
MGECAPPAAAPAPTTAKTSVWWDIDKCAVPRGRCDPHRIAHNLIAALAAAGYAGPVSIAAYGDAARVPPPVLAALSATGICLNHVPAGSKDTSEKRMLVDMLFWAFDNPPPGNYLLISGDQDLSDLLHRLRMKRYDILLVRPPNASSQALAAAAKKVWLWENLTAGELLLPEPPPARSVLGCKLNVNSSGTLSLGYKLNANGTDAMKCSQSKVCSEYGKGDINGKTGNQNRVKSIQKYVKKANSSSTPGINQDRVGPAGGVSESYAGSRSSEIDHSSFSSLSSSISHSPEYAKVDTSVPQETLTSKLPYQKSVSSTHSQQVEATYRFVPGEKPSTSTEWVPKSATLDLGSSNGQYNRTSQHLRYSEAQNKVHYEFTTGGNKGEAVNRPGVKPLQKYVKKTKVASCSANKQGSSVRVHDRPIGNSTIELDQTSASSSSTSTVCHSSAQKPVASAHLHEVKAPHESILGKKPRTPVEQVKAHESILGKPSTSAEQVRVSHESILGKNPSTSVEHTSRGGTHDLIGKLGNDQKLNKDQTYVRWVDVSSASAKINPSAPLDNSNGSTLSYLTQNLAVMSSSKSLESAKVNASSPLLSAHNRLNISECSRGITETRPLFQGAPTNDPSMELPDISGLCSGFDKSISSLGFNTSSYVNQSTDPQSSQPPCGNNCRAVHQPYNPPNSPEIEGIIGIILHALGTLKTEKIFPTESNIADCICYGEMNLTAFDVKKALELAIRHETVVMKKLLHDMPLFVAKDESLWKCVNVTNSKAKNPIEELETVYNYMSSTDGYSAIKNSQSR